MSDLLQYRHVRSPVSTACGMCAGGTSTTPSTTRVGRHEKEPPGTTMLRHVGPGAPPEAGHAVAALIAARAAMTASAVRTYRYYSKPPGRVPEDVRSSTRSLGSTKPNLR